MPDDGLDGNQDSGTQSSLAPSPGGAAPGQVPSGQPGAGGGNLPPAGAPGSQAVSPLGLIALRDGLAGQGMRFIFMALKASPPDEAYEQLHKAYAILSKHFRKQDLPQGQGMPQVPQFPGIPGAGPGPAGQPPGGMPPTGTPNLPRGPAPMPMPA